MNASEVGDRLVACAECGTVAFGSGEPTCCGASMTPPAARPGSTESDDDGREPSLETVLRVVLGMSPAELDVCLCVMEAGGTTVAELAERVDYDRSVVARHCNHLAALGVVEKRRQLLDRGGDVYVYVPQPPPVVRRRLRESFLAWAGVGAERVEELSREKVEGIADAESATEWTVFRDA
ncbi:MarR family transcriptional regulator [Halobaculum marinum]|uniref:MarR family transcriptional regulator n=1 Tax=Halobaculum marinum TaxID=3031996 RepID=A0ABD5X1I0_9EURY|nr:MarR family transcriptional regulator [Halobaculum sp. DT55]